MGVWVSHFLLPLRGDPPPRTRVGERACPSALGVTQGTGSAQCLPVSPGAAVTLPCPCRPKRGATGLPTRVEAGRGAGPVMKSLCCSALACCCGPQFKPFPCKCPSPICLHIEGFEFYFLLIFFFRFGLIFLPSPFVFFVCLFVFLSTLCWRTPFSHHLLCLLGQSRGTPCFL